MKYLKPSTLILIAFTSLVSCDPSAEEVQKKQQAILDSVARATEENIVKRLNDQRLEKERLLKLEQEKLKRDTDKTILKGYLTQLDTELEVQKQRLEDIKQPKFLRTVDEKEIEIRNQLLRIQRLRSKMDETVSTITKIDAGEPYDLQSIASASRTP